jgi:hypothetical protein
MTVTVLAAREPARCLSGSSAAGSSYIWWIAFEKPRLVEFVLREDDLAVRPHENAPGNPAFREGSKQRAAAVGDHRELELVLLLPGPASVLRLERAEAHDLETVTGKALKEVANGRRLLPTTQSSRFPEDEKQSVRAFDGQAQLRHRDGAPGLNALRESFNDLHLPPTTQTPEARC